MTARIIMQTPDIHRVLTRIAHEILESNRGSDNLVLLGICLLYTSPSPRDGLLSRMPSSA